MMKNLENLRVKKKKLIRELNELREEVKEKQDELDKMEDKIARIEGAPGEMQVINEDAKSVIRNIKKRPRPSYKDDFNWEQEECIEKKQKRNKISQGKV